VVAANRRYWVCLQRDANLVLFNSAGAAIWASNTAGYSDAAPFAAVMMRDGNFNRESGGWRVASLRHAHATASLCGHLLRP
jgi:hypothetical protein